MPNLTDIQSTGATLRGAAYAARSRVNAVEAQLVAAAVRKAAAQRSGSPAEAAAIEAEAQRLAAERAAALAARDAAAAQLHDQLGDLIAQIDPAASLGLLDANVPVALLPVRLETRFNPDNPAELLVRVLPDDIHGNSHEPEFTAKEVSAAHRYWTAIWSTPAALDADQAAWQELTTRVGINRAGWIARAMTPANIQTRPAATPAFPDVPLKGESWSRAAWATAMPDRWVITAYRGEARVATAWGNPVPDHVHMGPDPSAPALAVSAEGQPRVDPGLHWVIDFAAAEKIGLGIRVVVPPDGGFDRVLAFGIRGSLAPDAGAARLTELFDAHHYTRGLSVVPHETPTNNTPTDRSGWSARATAANTFEHERRPAALSSNSAGTLLAQALGLELATFGTVQNGALDEQSGAAAMATLLFETTLGYYLEQLMQGFDVAAPGPSVDTIAAIRRHFIDHVRARGLLPALRVGNQPYGVLPVTSLARWQPLDEDPATRQLPQILRALQLFWSAGAAKVPHLAGSADVDQDFVHALTLAGRSETFNVRTVQNPMFCPMSHALTGDQAVADPCYAAGEMANAVWAAFDIRGGLPGHPFHPRIAGTILEKDAPHLRLPLVDGAPGPQTYLQTLRTATLAQISSDETHVSSATSVLATLARHAVLLAYGTAADELGRRSLTPTAPPPSKAHISPEMFGVTATVAAESNRFTVQTKDAPLAAITTPIANVTAGVGAADYLRSKLGSASVDPILIDLMLDLREVDGALADLAGRSIAELETLMMETLDTVSHRFDAWVTSLAERRLQSLRLRAPQGVLIGGYGWVENLQRRPMDPTVAPPQGETGPLRADVNGGGFVHAPTLNQAAAAGVLRSAHLSHAGSPSDGALAIDLSSRRVYLATELLDGVRAGQPLGALLGYRLERNLHEGYAPLELDRYIAPLRRLAPLAANSAAPPGGVTLEAIAARNVVDGLALVRLDPDVIRAKLVADVVTPAATAVELNAVMGEIAKTMDAVDALSDLMISESVYQVIQGNTARAAMTVDAINRGAVLPEPDVARTNRSGTALAHRLLTLVAAADNAAAPGWSRRGPRASAEPHLDTWAGRLLGDPARVRVRVEYRSETGVGNIDVALSEVIATTALSATDVLYDSNAVTSSISTLEMRLLAHLALAPPPTAPAGFTAVRLTRGRDPAWSMQVVSFEEFVVFAASLRALVVSGRAVASADLARPENSPEPGIDVAEISARATTAEGMLQAAVTSAAALLSPIQSTDLAALATATDALGAFGLLPASAGAAASDLNAATAHLAAALAAARGRLAKAQALLSTPRPATDPTGSYDFAILTQLFGEDFRILPVVTPANAAQLTQAFAASTALQGGRPLEAWRWVRRTGTVRPSAARLGEALLFAQTLGTGSERDLAVAQIPFDPAGSWIGLPGRLPTLPTTGLVAQMTGAIDFAAGVAGLFIDEWTEIVPSDTQTTGVSFQASTPSARAPQSILLAVSPDPSKPWNLDTFEAILNETFDLAGQRLVDLDTLPWLGHFLPAIYIADSALDTTIGVRFKDIVKEANAKFASSLAGGG